MGKKSLNDRQKAFCREYIIDFNATQAYIRAGYSKTGAEVSACQLLRNPNVQECIAKLAAKVCDKAEVTATEVLQGIKSIATGNEIARDKLKAWELLGKYLKLFTEKVEHEHSGGISIMGLSDIREHKKGVEG